MTASFKGSFFSTSSFIYSAGNYPIFKIALVRLPEEAIMVM